MSPRSALTVTTREVPRRATIWVMAVLTLVLWGSFPLLLHWLVAAPLGVSLRLGFFWLWLVIPACAAIAAQLVPLRELSKWSAARARLEPVLAAALGWLDRDDVVLFYMPDWVYYVAHDPARRRPVRGAG